MAFLQKEIVSLCLQPLSIPKILSRKLDTENNALTTYLKIQFHNKTENGRLEGKTAKLLENVTQKHKKSSTKSDL